MARGVIPSVDAWKRTAAIVQQIEREPLNQRGAIAPRVFRHRGCRLIRITSAASGGGKYNGKLLNSPASSVTPTGTLATADMGSDGVDVLVLNAAEAEQATHDLTAGTPVQTVFIASYVGMSDEETPRQVYVIGSFAASTEELQVITDITGATLDCDTKDIDITATRVIRRVLVTEPPES